VRVCVGDGGVEGGGWWEVNECNEKMGVGGLKSGRGMREGETQR